MVRQRRAGDQRGPAGGQPAGGRRADGGGRTGGRRRRTDGGRRLQTVTTSGRPQLLSVTAGERPDERACPVATVRNWRRAPGYVSRERGSPPVLVPGGPPRTAGYPVPAWPDGRGTWYPGETIRPAGRGQLPG